MVFVSEVFVVAFASLQLVILVGTGPTEVVAPRVLSFFVHLTTRHVPSVQVVGMSRFIVIGARVLRGLLSTLFRHCMAVFNARAVDFIQERSIELKLIPSFAFLLQKLL